MNRSILILAGGAGTRLWPLSTDQKPKQFLELFGGESLIQKTWSRLLPLTTPERMFVSTNEKYAPLVAEQLPDLPKENILVEPARRNTAPALATCCYEIARRDPATLIGIFPSDHAIVDDVAFRKVVSNGFDHAAAHDVLMTIAIQPTGPNTGYGYLHLGDELADGILKVQRFVEKPDAARAQQFFDSGEYAWNGGMFLWRAEVFERELQASSPEIAKLAKDFVSSSNAEERRTAYEAMPSISIDYALMEKASAVAASKGPFDWSDVGSWSAVAELAQNASKGQLLTEASSGVYVNSSSGRAVAVVGLENVAIVDSPDGLLVLDLRRAEMLSSVVKKLG